MRGSGHSTIKQVRQASKSVAYGKKYVMNSVKADSTNLFLAEAFDHKLCLTVKRCLFAGRDYPKLQRYANHFSSLNFRRDSLKRMNSVQSFQICLKPEAGKASPAPSHGKAVAMPRPTPNAQRRTSCALQRGSK